MTRLMPPKRGEQASRISCASPPSAPLWGPPGDLGKPHLDRAFRVSMAAACLVWPPGLFITCCGFDQAGFAMKVTVERAQLLKSLGHVHRVVERRNTIPILGNVLIRAESAKLSLKA